MPGGATPGWSSNVFSGAPSRETATETRVASPPGSATTATTFLGVGQRSTKVVGRPTISARRIAGCDEDEVPGTKWIARVEPTPESPVPPASSSATSTPAAWVTAIVSRDGSPSKSGDAITSPGRATRVTMAPGGGSVTLSRRSIGTSRTRRLPPGPSSGTSTIVSGSKSTPPAPR